MGFVYEAEDRFLRRRVALKLLAPMPGASDRAIDRFLREAESCARLTHPNVVSVYSAGEHDGVYYIAMELVRGRSIHQMIKEDGALECSEATRLCIGVCRALTAAHAAGVIHRDVKPANILRTEDGTAKLTDFGLVKLNDARAERLTRAGKIVGTPQFIAPELCTDRPVDERTDVYGLGATYYMMLTGAAPYLFGNPIDLLRAHVTAPVPDPRSRDPRIPDACAEIVLRAMSKAPLDRYPNAAEMEAALTAALSGPADRPPPPEHETEPGASAGGPAAAADSGDGTEAEGAPLPKGAA